MIQPVIPKMLEMISDLKALAKKVLTRKWILLHVLGIEKYITIGSPIRKISISIIIEMIEYNTSVVINNTVLKIASPEMKF